MIVQGQHPKSVLVYHTTYTENLGTILLEGQFKPGIGAGSELGDGFYGYLKREKADELMWGDYILTAEIISLNKFLFLEYELYVEYFGMQPGITISNYIQHQIMDKFKGCTNLDEHLDEIFPVQNVFNTSFYTAKYLLQHDIREHLGIKPYGIVYYGGIDDYSVVCWEYEHLVIPRELYSSMTKESYTFKEWELHKHESKVIELNKTK